MKMGDKLDEFCSLCAQAGKTCKLKVYQINFDEAIKFCEDEKCTYPLGIKKEIIVNRNFAEIKGSAKSIPPVAKKKTSHPKCIQLTHSLLPSFNKPTSSKLHKTLEPYRLNKVQIQNRGKEITRPLLATVQILKINNSSPGSETILLHKTNNDNANESTIPNSDVDFNQNANKQAVEEMEYDGLIECLEDLINDGDQVETDINQGLSEQTTPSLEITNTSICDQVESNKQVLPEQVIPSLENTYTLTKNQDMTIQKSDNVPVILPTKSTNDVKKDIVSKFSLLYPQWQNKEALCWLDVLMCLIVHSKGMSSLDTPHSHPHKAIVSMLVRAYNQALHLINKPKTERISKSGCSTYSKVAANMNQDSKPLEMKGDVIDEMNQLSIEEKCVKTGAGCQLLQTDFLPLMKNHCTSEQMAAFTILNNVREKIWHSLQSKLKCKKGENDSPLIALPVLAKKDQELEKLLNIKYSFNMKCTTCGYSRCDRQLRVLPTFINTAPNFNMEKPAFVRSCFRCGASSQEMVMAYERLPTVMLLHFQEGVGEWNVDKFDFRHQDRLYTVTGVIQYTNNPDHFVAWIRNSREDLWMECNDLLSPLCHYDDKKPTFDAKEVHIVMWEAQGCDSQTEENFYKSSDKNQVITSISKIQDQPMEITVTKDNEHNQPMETTETTHTEHHHPSPHHNVTSVDESVNKPIANGNSLEAKTVLQTLDDLGNPDIVEASITNKSTLSDLSNTNGSVDVIDSNDSEIENREDVLENPSVNIIEIHLERAPTPPIKPSFTSERVFNHSSFTIKGPLLNRSSSTGCLPISSVIREPPLKQDNRGTVAPKQQLIVTRLPSTSILDVPIKGVEIKLNQNIAAPPNIPAIETQPTSKLLEVNNIRKISFPLKTIGTQNRSSVSSSKHVKPLTTNPIIAKIMEARKTADPVKYSTRSKPQVFEGYKRKEKPVEPGTVVTNKQSKSRSAKKKDEFLSRSQTASPVIFDFDTNSQPPSPALSCHSDSAVLQKRKSEFLADEWIKRRRSESSDSQTDIKKSFSLSNSLGSCVDTNGKYGAFKTMIYKDNVVPPVDSGSDPMEQTEHNYKSGPEQEILKNLYSNLSLDMPSSLSVTGCAAGRFGDLVPLPDMCDLEEFITSPDVSSSCKASISVRGDQLRT